MTNVRFRDRADIDSLNIALWPIALPIAYGTRDYGLAHCVGALAIMDNHV